MLHAIEEGNNETAAIAAAVAEAISSAHLATMGRIGIAYDLLPRESDILRRNFWGRAFERLKTAGRRRARDRGQARGLLGPAPLRVRGVRGARGAGQDPRPLQRHRDLHGQGHRLPALEVRPPRRGLRLRALRAPLGLRRRHRGGDPGGGAPPPVWRTAHGAGRARRSDVRAGRARLQRHRREAVLHAEGGQGGAARPRLRARSGGERPFLLRDRGALPEGRAAAVGAVRRGVSTDARRRAEALRRDVRKEGARREGRRPRRAAARPLSRRSREPPRERRKLPDPGPRPSRTPARSPSGRFATSS